MITTTAAPVVTPQNPTRATDPPPRLEPQQTSRIRAAALRATKLYPGPVGQLIGKELLDWEAFGFRFDNTGLTARLVEHLMTAVLEP